MSTPTGRPDARTILARIADFCVEDIMSMSDAEILAEDREDRIVEVVSGRRRLIYDANASAMLAEADDLLHEVKDEKADAAHALLHRLAEHLVDRELAAALADPAPANPPTADLRPDYQQAFSEGAEWAAKMADSLGSKAETKGMEDAAGVLAQAIRGAMAEATLQPASNTDRQGEGWRCLKCGGWFFTPVDERQANGEFAPGPLVRCIECKMTSQLPETPADPASAGSAADEVAAWRYYEEDAEQYTFVENDEYGRAFVAPFMDRIEPLYTRPQLATAPSTPGADAAEGLRDKAHTACFHYFHCGYDDGCGAVASSMADLAVASGFDKTSVLGEEIRATPRPPLAEPVTEAARDVLAERRRQVEAEGWTPKHDDEHASGEMALAACSYAFYSTLTDPPGYPALYWPWDRSWWKPKSPRADLVKAGALILAEIERLDRLQAFVDARNGRTGG